jgi:chemotaxis signal transduction protein
MKTITLQSIVEKKEWIEEKVSIPDLEPTLKRCILKNEPYNLKTFISQNVICSIEGNHYAIDVNEVRQVVYRNQHALVKCGDIYYFVYENQTTPLYTITENIGDYIVIMRKDGKTIGLSADNVVEVSELFDLSEFNEWKKEKPQRLVFNI